MDSPRSHFTKSDLIAAYLVEKDVPAVFELSGGMIAFLTDAIARLGKTPIINMRHEQAAGFAAEGATRVTGRSAIAMATSGPGATNLITAIASSYFDSVPTVFITGQVNQKELKKSKFQRQNGFQEFNVINAVKEITKYSISFNSDTDVLSELNKAWAVAHLGRPGPVLLDIPIDVQQELAPSSAINITGSSPKQILASELNIFRLLNLMETCTKPIFLLGGGVRTAQMTNEIRKIINKWKIPAVYSLMGVDVLDSSSPYRVGMIGSYGNRWANRAIARSDLIIALGTRLDIRQTGSDLATFQRNKRIFRVDIDPSEIKGRVTADISVESSLQIFLSELAKIDFNLDYSEWLTEIYDERDRVPQRDEQSASISFNPSDIMEWVGLMSMKANGFFVDVGQHQMWAAQSLIINPEQRFVTSGGLGAMGFALPAAIGASVASKGRWIVIAGDGCSQLSIAELQTAHHYNLPITICIVNNEQHGMVAQFQETNLNGRFVSTRDGYSAPSFCRIAQAFGIRACKIKDESDLKEAEDLFLTWNAGPLVLEFMVSHDAKALPKMEARTSIQDL